MSELQEVAYSLINNGTVFNTAVWQKMKTTKDIYQHIKSSVEEHLVYDVAVEIADIMFIQQKP